VPKDNLLKRIRLVKVAAVLQEAMASNGCPEI